MKVLKPGREQKAWATEVNCTGAGNGGGGCGALLLVESGDIYLTSRSPMGRDYEEFATFECPICKVETDLTGPKVLDFARQNGRRSGFGDR